MEDFELLESFVSESTDLIDDVEPLFIQLEKTAGSGQPVDLETVNRIFRLFHSMKGSAAFLNLNNVAGVTHHAETLLDSFRNDSSLPMTPYFLEVQLQTIDAIRTMLEGVAENGNDRDYEELKETTVAKLVLALERLRSGEVSPPAEEAAAEVSAPAFEPEDAEVAVGTAEEEAEKERLKEMIAAEGEDNFIQEGLELLDRVEQCLLALQKATGDECGPLMDEAFRLLHNFKGSAGMLQYRDLNRVSHAAENVLDAIRSGKVDAGEQNIEILLQAVDILSDAVTALGSGKSPEIPNADVMVEFINDIAGTSAKAEAKPAAPAAKPAPAPKAAAAPAPKPAPAAPPAPAAAAVEAKPAAPTKIPRPGKSEGEDDDEQGGGAKKEIAQQTIRVDLKRLDKLINLVGELVIAESMVFRLLQIKNIDNDNDLERKIHHLQRVSSELQDVAMSVRMIPLAATFKKMIRLIHDLSHKSNKKVNMKLIGEETEVDKNVIEQINDPLVHIIRNSVDHGIETSEQRLEAGKSETGTVTLEAKHEGGEVWISISDDGRGISREKVLAKAIERGLVNGDGSEMTEEEVFQLLFEPGFSTADKVTDISGRGVGMDVVKKNIEKLNGRIKIRSTVGVGTTMSLRIPLTLAIIDGMLIKVGESLYIIPLLSIRESLRGGEDLLVTLPDGSECITVRNEQIPVLRLYKAFRKQSAAMNIGQGVLVIVEADGQKAALLVDEIVGQQEVVIKGLSSYLGTPKGISGCTVLGDGEVSLIIDISSLLSRAHKG